MSLPLADEQCVAEAKQPFKASVARIHIEAWNIAFGNQKAYPGSVRSNIAAQLFDKIYMFNCQSCTNLDYRGFLGALVISILFRILAIPFEEVLLVEYIIGSLTYLLIERTPKLYKSLLELSNHVRDCSME